MGAGNELFTSNVFIFEDISVFCSTLKQLLQIKTMTYIFDLMWMDEFHSFEKICIDSYLSPDLLIIVSGGKL